MSAKKVSRSYDDDEDYIRTALLTAVLQLPDSRVKRTVNVTLKAARPGERKRRIEVVPIDSKEVADDDDDEDEDEDDDALRSRPTKAPAPKRVRKGAGRKRFSLRKKEDSERSAKIFEAYYARHGTKFDYAAFTYDNDAFVAELARKFPETDLEKNLMNSFNKWVEDNVASNGNGKGAAAADESSEDDPEEEDEQEEAAPVAEASPEATEEPDAHESQ